MTTSKPKYFLVRALGPDGQPHGKAIGHVEDYGSGVPMAERFVAFCYLPNDGYPEVIRVGTRTAKADAFQLVREAQVCWSKVVGARAVRQRQSLH
jgi:hypothetical protein